MKEEKEEKDDKQDYAKQVEEGKEAYKPRKVSFYFNNEFIIILQEQIPLMQYYSDIGWPLEVHLDDIIVKNFFFIESLKTLQVLRIKDIILENLLFIKSLSSLQALYINTIYIGEAYYTCFKNLENLTGLSITSAALTNPFTGNIANLTNIIELNLSFNPQLTIESLLFLSKLTNIIDLAINIYNKEDLQHLKTFSNLKKININNKNILNEVIKDFIPEDCKIIR